MTSSETSPGLVGSGMCIGDSHGIAGAAAWQAICSRMEQSFASGNYGDGVIHGVAEISKLLAEHFPRVDAGPNELPDRPVVL